MDLQERNNNRFCRRFSDALDTDAIEATKHLSGFAIGASSAVWYTLNCDLAHLSLRRFRDLVLRADVCCTA